VTYWRDGSDTRIQTPIVSLPTLSPNTWYHFRSDINKLTATSASIDVSLVELDGSGNPTGSPYTGTVADTSTWAGGAPATGYFTAPVVWPAYKNYNAISGAADNACYEAVSQLSPIITSTPVTTGTEGQAYAYDVSASGDPAPTFELTVFPAGMTINPTSGLIEWTAGIPDDYDVTVVATNTHGTDEQSFTITVATSSGPASKPVLIAPEGDIGAIYNPTYSWHAATNAERYRLGVVAPGDNF
jgi:hypothetical protein